MKADFPMDRDEQKEYILEKIEEVIEAKGGIIKTSEILGMDIDYRRIEQFVKEGSLRKVRNGVYTSARSPYSEEALIAAMYPDGVITMESALYKYGYLKKKPLVYSVAISKNASKSRFSVDYPMVVPYYTEPEVLALGVEEIKYGDADMHIYSKERLICDVLKYESKMSREDFKDALLAYISDDKKDIARLMEYARTRKVRQKVQNMIGTWL
ncbi:MAG: type IV toxin-antitoxin system AbiEi family antitoxin domain-containing protein [Lachnospiraceae bacterium]|nr:type IV toxin-antitoxin system AbiEi family antitoxin domain-containing protein [Lachnospiraceae bacterium]